MSKLFRLGDELRDFGVRANRLDQYNQAGIQVHAVRLVKFLAALDQNVVGLLGVWIRLRNHVINVGHQRVPAVITL